MLRWRDGAKKITAGGSAVASPYVIGANRDHEFGIREALSNDAADRQFPFYTWFGAVFCEDDDLLYGIVSKNSVNFIPEIITAVESLFVDPDPIPSSGELGRQPEREVIIFRSSVGDEGGSSHPEVLAGAGQMIDNRQPADEADFVFVDWWERWGRLERF